MKISKSSLYHGIELVLLYQIAFVRFPYLSWYPSFQRVATILLVIMTLPHIIMVWNYCNKSLMNLLMLYIMFIIISAVVNRNKMVVTNTLVGGMLYALAVWDMVCVIYSTVARKGIDFVLKIFFNITFLYVVVTDMLLLFDPGLFGHGYYFIGNKFSVVYKHFELLMFVLFQEKRKKPLRQIIKISMLCFITCMIAVKVGSATGIVGVLVFLVIYFLIPEQVLYNPILFPSVLVGSALLIFVSDTVLTWKPVSVFITEFLKRDMTLTGRTYIYAAIPKLLKGHLLLGYGYNTAYEVWTNYSWYTPNAQNGLINFIFEQGIFSAICVILFGIKSFSLVRKSAFYYKFKSMAVLIMVYSIIAAVEIDIDITFVAFLVLFSSIMLLKKEDGGCTL